MTGTVTIVNYNANAASIVSAAGRISTTKGSADEIYQNSCNNEEAANVKLIHKILSSGHESVLEHVSLNLSFDNVSVFVEQFMIEFRLASFTVKSRRYVDFGDTGFVLPDFEAYAEQDREKLQGVYRKHMEYLFGEYNALIEAGIPKEDARFVLPYSFKSNFYCTVNARELVKIMNEMVSGRGKDYPELVALGNSLFAQCEEKLPYLKIEKPQTDSRTLVRKYFAQNHTATLSASQSDELVSLISGTEEPEKIICKAAALNCGVADWAAVEIEDAVQQREIIGELIKGGRKRELEQVSFTILFRKMSLAGVTHLVRHRMQAIVVPSYVAVCDYDKYVLPESIVKAGLEERYRETFRKSREVAEQLANLGYKMTDKIYLLLSGMTIPIMTTMNANELCTFMKLRTCNRAQWEIKECADALLDILREKYPILFSVYGPSCYMLGKCPEGRMTCGFFKEVCDKYAGKAEE